MKNILLSLGCGLALVSGAIRAADDDVPGLDAHAAEALRQTQSLLKDPDQLKALSAQDPKAAATMNQVRALAGSDANAQKIYELAAEVFGGLTQEAQGSPEAMRKKLDQASRDPAAFGATFTPEQLRKLQEISRDAAPAQAKKSP
jgi:hypothetical protein